ncbi:MAG: Mur ligase family protein [Candidatus Micrarchaeota archaeon]|nr:Mur ligase family protein [Candidatus Micrarchaeota archaeon]
MKECGSFSRQNVYTFRYYENYHEWDEKSFVELLELNSIKKTKISHYETLEFLKSIGAPNEKLDCIHIAGTNGKGSVVSFCTYALLEKGLKVGTFISPHVMDYRERFLVNGKLYDGNVILQEFKNLLEYKPKNLTKFELMTAFAFYLFDKLRVDIGVIETGMGGRLDATRVCKPIISVITGIGFDHMQYLGNTYEEITYEKINIGRENVPMIINSSNENVRLVARNFCSKNRIPLRFVDYVYKIVEHDYEKLSVEYEFEDRTIELQTHMIGTYNVNNMATAYFALKDMLSEECIKKGFRKAFIPIRMQIEYVNGKLIVIDAAHNQDGIKSFVKCIEDLENFFQNSGKTEISNKNMYNNKKNEYFKKYQTKRIGLIFNTKFNKDYVSMTYELINLIKKRNIVNVCIPDFSKGLEIEKVNEIEKMIKSNATKVNVLKFENISSAFKFLIADNTIEEIYVTGSIYMIGELFAETLNKKITWKEQD